MENSTKIHVINLYGAIYNLTVLGLGWYFNPTPLLFAIIVLITATLWPVYTNYTIPLSPLTKE